MFIKVRLKGTAAHTPRRHPTPRGDSLHPLHTPHHKRGGGRGIWGGESRWSWGYFLLAWAVPTMHSFTLLAKRRELSDSAKFSSSGEMLTNMSILALPLSEFCSR